jgi:hypothetical protein
MTPAESGSGNDVAVVYLARFEEGPKPMAAFIESCKKHRAGAAHDRIVIRKGFSGEDTAQDRVIGDFFSSSISVSDNGFDITAYAEAARQLRHKYVIFFNTFSEISSDDWLLKLRSAFEDPNVGIAGASGSYESLYSSMKRLRQGMFGTEKQFFSSQTGLRRGFQIVRKLLPKRSGKWLVAKLIAHFAVRSPRVEANSNAHKQFEIFWAKETAAGGTYEYLSSIPGFPNPHIRTNAFMMERSVFLQAAPHDVLTKKDTYLFESGPQGLTQRVLQLGKSIVIVGRDGRSYGIDHWSESDTFRQGDQRNLLVHDNQTRAFTAMSRAQQRAFAEMTWGAAASARSSTDA